MMKKSTRRVLLLVLSFLGCLAGRGSFSLHAQEVNPRLYDGLRWRLIGPFRGGRVEAVTGLPGRHRVFYMGSVDGGVWKTSDAGQTWMPLFQHEPVSSVGAIAIDTANPNVIYVGTGEPSPRGDATYGDGMYKSTDGGRTWEHIGLTDTRHIARILIDPRDQNRIFVAALGRIYGPNAERGVFRSDDGGRTWAKVLYKNDTTGAIDLILDPNDSRVLYAALWTVQRTPWLLSSGGSPEDGLYKSTDGGTTWHRVGGPGWPQGLLGRIGVAISAANSNRIYALVEAKGSERGLYRSDDGGQSWRQVNAQDYLLQRPWYFTNVFADPRNANTVYVLNLGMWRSSDGGIRFQPLRVPHGDCHALWIDPHDSSRMILGSDGGAAVSLADGATWSSLYNQPTGQFYHVAADNRFDYRICGAQQDDSPICIATRTRHASINATDYFTVGEGESGYVVPSPVDPDIVFSGNKEMQTISRFDRRTEQARDITEWPISTYGWPAAPLQYRFNWTEPIVISPFNPRVIYHAAQVVFESANDGESWKVISPDLTRNDKAKQQSSGGPLTKDNSTIEYYDVIFTVAESPVQKGVIWAGTDDGLVWVTRDGGAHWANVTPRDLPAWYQVSLVEPSPYEAGSAYIAVNGFKNGDKKPYIWKTGNYGETWTSLTKGIPEGSFVRAVREDPVRRGLLFAGTEEGVYVSFDDGARWQSLELNLPTCSVRDLIVHGNDLVIATHGRAFWSLDDITPLRQIDGAVAGSGAYLYQPQVAYRVLQNPDFGARVGLPIASNPPEGAAIDYYLRSSQPSATLTILNAQGQVVRQFKSQTRQAPVSQADLFGKRQMPLTIRAGMSRFVWDLRYSPPPQLATHPGPWQGGPARGPLVLPGRYEVRLTVGSRTLLAPLKVKIDPAIPTPRAELERQFDLLMKIRERLTVLVNTANEIHSTLKKLSVKRKQLAGEGNQVADIDRVEGEAEAIERQLYQHHLQVLAPEDDLASPTRIRERLIGLEDLVGSSDNAPTPQEYEVFRYLSRQLDQQIARWDQVQQKEFPAVEKMAAAAGASSPPRARQLATPQPGKHVRTDDSLER